MEVIADKRIEPQVGERYYASLDTRISTHAAPGSDGEKKRFSFVINTGAQDRHGSIVVPEGGDLTAYKRNPMVLFNHDMNMPIGRAVSVELKGGKLIGTVEFDSDDPEAAKIERKVENGFINATSIGFIVKEWTFDEDTDVFRVLQWELVEFSIVTVPSNPEALLEGRSMNIRALKEEIASLRDAIKELKAPAVSEDEPAESVRQADEPEEDAQPAEDEDQKPAEAEASAEPIQKDGEASQQQEPVQEESTPEGDSSERAIHNQNAENTIRTTRRVATEEDYRRLAQHLVPVVQDVVLRRLGKK